MSEGLDALERIKNNLKDSDNYINLFDTLDLITIEKELEEKSYLQKFACRVFENLVIEVGDNSYEDEDGHAYYGLTFVCKNGDRFSISCSKQEHKYWFGDGDGPYGPEDLK